MPEALDQQFSQAVVHMEEERKVAYVTSIERFGIRQGIQQGVQQGKLIGQSNGMRELLQIQLAQRFGTLPASVTARLEVADIDELRRWGARVLQVDTLDQLWQ